MWKNGEQKGKSRFLISLACVADTECLAGAVASVSRASDVLTLEGPLGTGKTTFARAFVAAMGGGNDVPSPTFPLVQTLPTLEADIWHFDLHRLERANDVWELGLEEALAEGITLIEWPEIVSHLLPSEHLRIVLSHVGPDARSATLIPGRGWSGRIERSFTRMA